MYSPVCHTCIQWRKLMPYGKKSDSPRLGTADPAVLSAPESGSCFPATGSFCWPVATSPISCAMGLINHEDGGLRGGRCWLNREMLSQVKDGSWRMEQVDYHVNLYPWIQKRVRAPWMVKRTFYLDDVASAQRSFSSLWSSGVWRGQLCHRSSARITAGSRSRLTKSRPMLFDFLPCWCHLWQKLLSFRIMEMPHHIPKPLRLWAFHLTRAEKSIPDSLALGRKSSHLPQFCI